MLKFRISSILIPFLCLFFANDIFAGTTITLTDKSGGWLSTTEIGNASKEYEKFIDDFFTKNEQVLPSGMAMVNTLGYPNGKAIIDNLQFGTAIGIGILEYTRYNNYSDSNPTVPSAGANAGFHIGIGITKRIDITAKLFNLGWIYRPEYKKDKSAETTAYDISVEEVKVISAGLKFRYNLVQRTRIIPIILSFGGITLGLQFDYMKGSMESTLKFTETETISYGGISTSAVGEWNNTGKLEWQYFTVTPEILMYFDVLYFFSLYTGPGISFNTGSMDFSMTGTGTVKQGSTTLATGTVDINYKLKPYRVMPKWTAGLEVNLFILKLQAEVASMLLSPTETVYGQVGVRMQF